MASSGSFENAFRSGYTLLVEWKINSQNIENNTSSVTVTAYLESGGSSYVINSSAEKTVRLYINGTTYTHSATNLAKLSGGQKKQLYTKTVTISHASDGTKKINLACEFDLEVTLSGTYWGTVRAPGGSNSFISATLNTIPRKTTPTTSGTWNVGNSVTISTSSRASSNFTHTLQYSLNNSTWTNIATGVTTSTTWTLPAALANATTGATSGTVYIRCTTYNGSTNVGSVTITRTFTITSSYAAPTVTLTASQTNSGGISGYVRGQSKVTLNATAVFKNGAKASKYVFTYGSTSRTVAATSASSSITFTLPNDAASSYSLKVTVTDSRGFTATHTTSITTLAYSAPDISSVVVTRGTGTSSSAFVENNKGNNLRIRIGGTITSLSNLNTKTYKIEYRLSNSTSYSTLTNTTTISSYAFSIELYTGALFSENSSYVLRVSISDSFETVSQIIDVSSQKVLLNFSPNGKAMAIGGIASIDDTLEIMLESYSTGGIKPIFIADGTDLNEIVKTGLYVGSLNLQEMLNAPIQTGSFTLEVKSAGTSGQIMQRYSYCHKEIYRAYVRFLYQGTWGEWQPAEGFTAFETTGYAGHVRFANGFLLQWGRVSIAPDAADETKEVAITYPIEFTHAPIVQAQPHTTVPHMVEVAVGTGSVSGSTIYLRRTNTTATWVSWVAIGRG
jgi:hypothetical protein